MARDAQTTVRSGAARLETAALLLAGFAALAVIARSEAVSHACEVPAAVARSVPAPVPAPAPETGTEAARQVMLRDMRLHD